MLLYPLATVSVAGGCLSSNQPRPARATSMVVDRPRVGSTRERVLQAAERVIIETGAARLTLEGVAQAASVSKGGLLYHFPSKESLLCALAQRYVENIDKCIGAAKNGLTGSVSRNLKAIILGELGSHSKTTEAMMLAMAANDVALLKVIRAHVADYTSEIKENSADFPRAAIISLAIDGLKMRESMRISAFTTTQREEIVQELLKLADEACR